MKQTTLTTLMTIGLCLVSLPPRAFSAPEAAASQQSSAIEDFIAQSKKPAPWVTLGADLRLRNEYFNNAQTLWDSDALNLNEQDYFRYRGRVWTSLSPVTNLSFNARFSTEVRTWMKPASYSPHRGRSGTDATYGIFDNFYLQWKEIANTPAYLTVGRQDYILHEGWLVLDGTPNDGSWTYYLDVARLNYDIKDIKTSIDAVAVVHYARDDEWLPTVNNQNRGLTDQIEKGAIIDISNYSIPELNVDGYFIYKHDTRMKNVAEDPNLRGLKGDDADIYTLGLRFSGTIAEHWKYFVDGAYQFGEKHDPSVRLPVAQTDFRDINAYGLNSRLGYHFKDKMNNVLSLSYEFLSGDDPSTTDDEMFDLLWGRWPRWSELYNVYSYVSETRVAQTANLHKIGPSWNLTPAKNLDFSASYFLMFADRDTPSRASAASAGLFSNEGNFRGHYLQTVLKYKFSRHLASHLWSEFVFPGDYYSDKDLMTFLRAEIYLSY